MSAEELEKYARDGALPGWFEASVAASSDEDGSTLGMQSLWSGCVQTLINFATIPTPINARDCKRESGWRTTKLRIRVARPSTTRIRCRNTVRKRGTGRAVWRRNHPQFAPILHPAVLLVWDVVAALVANLGR